MISALRTKQVIRSLNSRTIPLFIRCITDKTEDVPIHTGQQWESDDYRLARFSLAPKQVNKNWAVNLIAEVPPKEVTEHVVWCDGGSGPEGHPRVYINVRVRLTSSSRVTTTNGFETNEATSNTINVNTARTSLATMLVATAAFDLLKKINIK